MRKFIFCIFLSLFVFSFANYSQIPFPDEEPLLKTETKGSARILFFKSKIQVKPQIQLRLSSDKDSKSIIIPQVYLEIPGTKAVVPEEAYFDFFFSSNFGWQNKDYKIALMSGDKNIFKDRMFYHPSANDCDGCVRQAFAVVPYAVFKAFAKSGSGTLMLGGKEFKFTEEHFQAFRDMIELIEQNAGTSK